MSKYLIKKASLKGTITIPSSKSHTLRAILFATLAKGKSVIHQYLHSTDTLAMIEACRLFGATIEVNPSSLSIHGLNGKIRHTEDVINANNAGIVLRFCSAIGALGSHPVVITGDHSIRHLRPMQQLLDGLTQLNVSATSMRGDGFAPVIIQGPIIPGKINISGEDSQPISALLIAAAFAEGPIEIRVQNPGEKPWVGLTLDWFDRLGIPYSNENFEYYRMKGHARYDGFEYTVPGDFSSAAFPIAAALITQSEVTLNNIDMSDSQGDKALIAVFQKMGAQIDIDEENKTLRVKKSPSLSGISVDINDFIDSISALSVVACFAEGETHIQNASSAKQKECNRIQCLASELGKMGANIIETEDGLIVKKSSLKGANLYSHQDHRMAMSLAVAALGASGETTVDSVACVAKTFPNFVQELNALGSCIKEIT